MEHEQNSHTDRTTTYKPDELPTSVTRTLWISYGMGKWNAGQIEINDYVSKSSDGFEKIPLCQHEVTIQIPQPDDIKAKAVEVLEEQKRDLQARHHQELKAVQEKIDNLLAIEFKPGEAA
jgi:hypothetical protein